jgi:hypothetical protein
MRIWLQVGIVAMALMAALAPLDPRLVERVYSTGLYPVVQRLVTPVSNLVPFAWLDVLTVVGAVSLIAFLFRVVRRAPRKKRSRYLLRAAATLVTTAAAAYLLFLALWGFNYRRVSMMERLVVERGAPSSDAVLALGLSAVDHVNTLYTAAHDQGWRTAPWRDHVLSQAYADVLRLLSDASPTVPGRLKSSIYGPYFRWASVDGMVNPFALEAIANPDLLPFERPFVAAHEWAHLAGYADESEASFVGWLTCVRASPPAAYSGWLFLYWQINSEVGTSERRKLSAALADGPRSDVAAIAARLQQGQVPLLRNASWKVYDQYLKANRVEDGVRSYGAVVTLLLRSRFDEGWKPVRRLGQ